MSQLVETEEEAIKLAEALLAKAEAEFMPSYTQIAEEAGWRLPSPLHILCQISQDSQAWTLIYRLKFSGRVRMESLFETISVNRRTGEAKFING
jgi:hypothetical protein